MPTFFRELLGQLRGIWKRAKTSQKAAMILLTLGTLGGIAGLCVWARTPHFQLLYANLDAEDAAHIVEGLQEGGFAYRLTHNGTSISVPSDKVYELRIKFASEGYPKSSPDGWEIFDKSVLGMTEFLQDVNYTRALQGELSRTICQMDPVERAIVHIVRPRPTLFKAEEEPVTASIVVKTRAGAKLTPSQVAGICQLVANAVEGMAPERVSVMDTTGRILSEGQVSPENLTASNQLEIQQNWEERLTAKAQSLLDLALGLNKASVRVVVELDFEKEEEVSEMPDPDTKVVISESIKTRESPSTAGTGGIVGVSGNVGANSPPALPGASGGSEEDITKEYEFGRTTKTKKKDSVSLKRLSVALLVDESLSGSLAKLEGIVKKAVGFDETRGDTFERSAVPFTAPDPTEIETLFQESEKMDFILKLAQYGAVAVASLFLFLLVRSLIKKNAQKALASPGEGGIPEGTKKQREEDEIPFRKEQIKKNLALALETNPQAVIQLMRAWIKEKKE